MNATPPAEPTLPPRYRIRRKLGEGGMGAVYLAEDQQRDGLPIALKTILPEALDQGAIEAFKNEFLILARLRHPNIAAAYDFGVLPGGGGYYTSEYVPGRPVAEAAAGLALDRLLDVTVQMCRGLEYVHSRGLVHHDVKNTNILVFPGPAPAEREATPRPGRTPAPGPALLAKIIDFGLVLSERAAREAVGGSPSYLAPEKIRNEPMDRRVDLYALGVLLYRLFAGRFPFVSENAQELLRMHLTEAPAPPSRWNPTLPKPLEEILLRLLEKDARKRFPTAASVIEAVNEGLGTDHPVETWGAKVGYIATGCLAGRDVPMERLRRSLDRTFCPWRAGPAPAEGDIRSFLVCGELGIGKTRLLQEAKTLLQVDGVRILDVSCPEDDARRPAALPILLDGLAAEAGAAGIALPEEAEGLRRKCRTPGARIGDDLGAVRRAVLAVAGRVPLAILADGLERAGDWTWEAFADVANALSRDAGGPEGAGPRAILLGALREEEGTSAEAILKRLGAEPVFGILRLEPLKDPEVRALVRSMFGRAVVPDGFFRRLTEFAKGNPFLIEEAIKTLAEDGSIARRGDQWLFTGAFDPSRLPAALVDLLARRVAGLSRDARRTLEALSLLREPRPPEFLAEILGAEPGLRELRQANLAWARADGACSAAHPRLAEAVRQEIPAPARASLHARIASVLEAREADDPLERAEDLAFHYREAGDREKSIAWGLRAAAALRDREAWTAAARVLESLGGFLGAGDPRVRLQVDMDLVRIYERAGEADKACERLASVLRDAGDLLPPHQRTRSLRRIAEIRFAQGRMADALERVDEGLAGPQTAWMSEEGFRLRLLRIRTLLGLGRVTEAEAAVAEAEKAAQQEPSRPPPFLAAAQVELGRLRADAHLLRGDAASAKAVLEAQQQSSRRLRLPEEQLPVANALGRVHLEWGRFREAGEAFEEARRLLPRVRDPAGGALAWIGIGETAAHRGDLAAGFGAARQGLDRAEASRDPGAQLRALRLLGTLFGILGRFDRSLDFYQRGHTRAQGLGDRPQLVRTWVDVGSTLVRLGEAESASALLDRALHEAAGAGLPLLAAEAGLARGRCLRALGRLQDAGDAAREAQAAFEAIGNPRGQVWARIFRAQVAAAQGDVPRAAGLLREAWAEASGLESKYVDANRLLSQAEIRALEGEPAQALAHAAEAEAAATAERYLSVLLRVFFLRILCLKAIGREEESREAKARMRLLVDDLERRWEPRWWPGYYRTLRSEYEGLKALLLGEGPIGRTLAASDDPAGAPPVGPDPGPA